MALPHTKARWARDVASHHLGEESLFTLQTLNSASKILLPQFLMLRVLYQPVKNPQTLHDLFEKKERRAVTMDAWTQTVTFLNDSQSFQEYLNSIENKRSAGSVFSMTRLYQRRCSTLLRPDGDVDSSGKIGVPRRVTRSQTRKLNQAQQSPSRQPTGLDAVEGMMEDLSIDDPKTPGQPSSASALALATLDGKITRYLTPLSGAGDGDLPPSITDKQYKYIEDEQIVNFALSLLLDSLVELCDAATGFWSPYRSPFAVLDQTRDEVFHARVDGLYRQSEDRPGDMIIEVKPYSRGHAGSSVDMQESAQMAAWISRYPRLPGQEIHLSEYRRILISQNRRQLFVTVATYDGDYIDYITGCADFLGRSADGPFLKMQRYGPYDIDDRNQMKWFCHVALALSIQGRILDIA